MTKPPFERLTEESPVFRMPTEISMLIFQQYGSDIRSRLTLTHTCRRWRRIAVNDAALWTNVFIDTRARNKGARLDNFLSFLGMQLDRTADLPLHVNWYADADSDYFVGTLQLIREKAPFFRWRTLLINLSNKSQGNIPWSSVDAFTNLETLTVWRGEEKTILNVLDRTITSRLKVLNLMACHTNILTTLAKSLAHISTLVFRYHKSALPVLPDNVVNLHLGEGQHHPFPHIQMYELRWCTFHGEDGANLQNMTTLTVTEFLIINGQVLLPAPISG